MTFEMAGHSALMLSSIGTWVHEVSQRARCGGRMGFWRADRRDIFAASPDDELLEPARDAHHTIR